MSNLLTNVIIWAYAAYKRIFTPTNYSVGRIFLEYYIDPTCKYEIMDKFWADEESYWDEDTTSFYVDVTKSKFRGTEIPQNVRKTLARLTYWYNGEQYKYCGYDIDFPWPPPQPPKEMQFMMPIACATLVDEDDKPKRDVTQKVKRYAGPRGDFHNEKVRISDLLYYDEETLKKEYPKIQITNAFGMKKTVSTVDGYTTDLRLP